GAADGEDAHPVRVRELRDVAADGAQTDDADGLAVQLLGQVGPPRPLRLGAPLEKATITAMTYSPMGIAWMPLAVVTVTSPRTRGLSRSRSAPAEVSCTQRRLGARSPRSGGIRGVVKSTSA